jgi:hypothetical protein
MSLGPELDFDLFDLGKVTYQGFLGSLFLSLPGMGLSVLPQSRGVEVTVLEDLRYLSKHQHYLS